MGSDRQGRFGMADGLAEFKKKRTKDLHRSHHDQEVDFDRLADEVVGYHTSEIREMVKASNLAPAAETEEIIRGEEPGQNPEFTETNRQTVTTVTSELTPSPLPLPVSPLMQRSPIQFPVISIGEQRDGQQRSYRGAGLKQTKQEELPPQVSMNDEQQDLLAWIILLERCEALHHARKERKVVLFNQCAAFVISVLGIIGGCIAIRSGVSSTTESNRR